MNILINGKQEILAKEINIQYLLRERGNNLARVIVELNEEVVKTKNWEETILKEGDKVEIIKIVSGG